MTGERRLSGSVPSVSDARLASVLDTAGDGIIVIDERATILMFNKACEMMFGYVASEVLGRNVAMLMPAEQAERHDSYLSAYKFTGRRRVIGVGREVQGRRKDGSLFPLYISVGEAQTPEGPQFIGILRDLSTRHETEAPPQRIAVGSHPPRPHLGPRRDGPGPGARTQPAAHRRHPLSPGREPRTPARAAGQPRGRDPRQGPQGGPAGRRHHSAHPAARREAGPGTPGRRSQRHRRRRGRTHPDRSRPIGPHHPRL